MRMRVGDVEDYSEAQENSYRQSWLQTGIAELGGIEGVI